MRTNQRGSILGFVIVGGVLALLLVGGAYFVRHTLASTDGKEEPVALQSHNDDSTQPSDNASDVPEEEDGQTNEETILPGRTDADTSSQGDKDAETLDDLPQTGPADALLSGILLSIVVAAGTAYKRSRAITTSL